MRLRDHIDSLDDLGKFIIRSRHCGVTVQHDLFEQSFRSERDVSCS